MPPRANVHNVGERGAADWYWELPPMTRGLLTVYLVTGLSAFLGVLPLKWLYHDWHLTFKILPEVWRLLTNFAFLGRPSLYWIFQLVFLIKYGGSYELAKFAHNTADGLTMLGIGAISGMSISLASWLLARAVPPVFVAPFNASALIFMLLYLWSRQNPEAPISLFGVVKLAGRHLPWAFLVLDMILGGSIWQDVQGILMGHTYWFLTEAYPLATGRHVVRTPAWLSCACLRYGFGRVPMAAVNPVNPSDVRFRAFQGRARRLAD